jgi:hypothetical protein
LLFFANDVTAEEVKPLLSGKVIISIKEETFDCDSTLTTAKKVFFED